MVSCPVCLDHVAATAEDGSNCFRCAACNELVFAIKTPNDPSLPYAAISNASGQLRDIPDDILLHTIVDQSPIADPPRNMTIEFDDGTSVIIINPLSDKTNYTKQTRKSLDKTASALNRNVLHVNLPIDLMDEIRNLNDDKTVG